MPDPLHSIRFPGETPEYRTARDALLRSEIELRAKIEEVAALRRQLPLGGLVPHDYVFTEGAVDIDEHTTEREVRLSELFRPGLDTLVLYSYMFSSEMKSPCTACTSILDGLNGSAPHITQRVSLAVVAKSPVQRTREVARRRGWRNLRLLSSANSSYNADYGAENVKANQLPALNVFVRRDGNMFHFFNTELLYAAANPGQDGRHVDMIWPLWNMFDFTPDGRGTDWNPKLAYVPA
jgi:predicted dithiol-disulfide oxidoreductase (DUF899 family)